jgi:hypothetical protein
MRSAEEFHAAKRLIAAGPGSISRNRRVWRLRITLDKKYPAIIDRCRQAIEVLMPGQCSGVVQRVGCVDISLYSKQRALVGQATAEFVLGLIHSDGCRVAANDRGVMSIRYHHFTNRSEDILGLFTGALDVLGIPWTRSTKYIVSIYRKAATARLDEFVRPKTRAVPLNSVHYTA